MLVYVALLVAVIGLLMFAFCANPKLSDVGKMSFFAGLLAFLLLIGGRTVGVLAR